MRLQFLYSMWCLLYNRDLPDGILDELVLHAGIQEVQQKDESLQAASTWKWKRSFYCSASMK